MKFNGGVAEGKGGGGDGFPLIPLMSFIYWNSCFGGSRQCGRCTARFGVVSPGLCGM